jgi:predicted transcriptional regulator
MIDRNENDVLEFIKKNNELSSKEVHEGISKSLSYAAIKRLLTILIDKNLLI